MIRRKFSWFITQKSLNSVTLDAAEFINYQFIISIPPLVSLTAFHKTLALISKGFALDGFLSFQFRSIIKERLEPKRIFHVAKSWGKNKALKGWKISKWHHQREKMLIKTFVKPLTFRSFLCTQSLHLFRFSLWCLRLSLSIEKFPCAKSCRSELAHPSSSDAERS